jgi:flagellar hook-length control protein FliK
MSTSALMTDLLSAAPARTSAAARRPEPKTEARTEARDFGRVLEDSRQQSEPRGRAANGDAEPRQNATGPRGQKERLEPAAKSASDRGENPPGLRKRETRELPKDHELPHDAEASGEKARPEGSRKAETDEGCPCAPAKPEDSAAAPNLAKSADAPSATEITIANPVSAEIITEVKISTDPALAIEASPDVPADAKAAVATTPAQAQAGPVVDPSTVAASSIAPAVIPPEGVAKPDIVALEAAGPGATAAVASVAATVASAAIPDGPAATAAGGKDSPAAVVGDQPQTAKNDGKTEAKASATAELNAASLVSKEPATATGKAPEPAPQSQTTAPAPSASPDATTPMKAADPASAMARADAPVPLQAVAVEIGMRAMRGSKEFSIRLDPEDLGRIDIKLEISEAGQVQAKLTVERVETLQLLQRDAKTLERAFDQAGLKTNPDGLQFSLRDPGQQGRQGAQQDQSPKGQRFAADDKDGQKIDEITLRPAIYRTAAARGLDIRI